MSLQFGGTGVIPSTRGQASTQFALQAGETFIVPASSWMIQAGRYTAIQEYDPIAGFWRTIGGSFPDASARRVESDGTNIRIANQTGCAVGALITNAGTGYTSAPTVTASGGASVWQAIVGGALSTSVSVTNGGTNYTYPPMVQISAPPAPGIQATAICTLSGSAVSTITVIDQGAGYTGVPTINLINDPRDTTGSGASAVGTLTGAGTVTGLICTNHGTPVTSLPTLTFSGGGGASAAATVIWCATITGFTLGTGGAGMGATGSLEVTGLDNFPATAAAYTNVTTQKNLVRVRKASIVPTMSGGAVTTTATILDGGIYTSVPTALVISTTPATTAATPTFTMGGATDVIMLQPI